MKKFYVGLTTIFLSALFSGANAQVMTLKLMHYKTNF